MKDPGRGSRQASTEVRRIVHVAGAQKAAEFLHARGTNQA